MSVILFRHASDRDLDWSRGTPTDNRMRIAGYARAAGEKLPPLFYRRDLRTELFVLFFLS